MIPIRKRPIQVHPLFQSLQPLGAMTLVLIGVGLSLANIGTGVWPGVKWSQVDALGRAVLSDAVWLLPALMSANLGLVALLFAQTVTNADAKLMASTRQVAIVGSVFIGACAAAVALLSFTALVRDPGMGAHLFAVLLLACVIIGITLWMSLLFFGTPAAQLAVALEIRRVTQTTLNRLGLAGPVPAWGAWVANVVIIAGASVLIYFVSTAAFDQPIPNGLDAVVVLAGLSMCATTVIYLAELGFAEWSSILGRRLVRVLLLIGLFGPVLLMGSALLLSGLSAAGLGVMAAVLLPLLSAWMPMWGWTRGWTLRAAVNRRTAERLLKHLDQLQAFIDDLRQRQTQTPLR